MTHPKSDKPLRPDLQQVREARAAILDDARPKAVAQQRKRGRWTARESIAALIDPESFVEYGGLARPAVAGMSGAADGVVMGTAQIEGRPVDLLFYDYTVYAGTQSAINHMKTPRMFEHAERHRLPVDDDWQPPLGGKGRPERGIQQLGSLGSGNHFIELQRCEETGTLFVQAHTGSRGWGHGLATNYFDLARAEKPHEIKDLDLGYFTPDSEHYRSYLNAVAAGGNFAIINRLIIFEQVAEAFEKVFGSEMELIYEISHNLVQKEWHPEFGEVWVHRKGATRAFPAGHPALAGTMWEADGHPVLIPGSNKDWSYVLRPAAGAVKSGYSVNHGAGRRMSRGEAGRTLNQRKIDDEYAAAGILVNVDGRVPIDEAAPCYKPSEEVVAAVVGAGLATIEYSLWPLASLKGTEGAGGRRGKRSKRK